MARKITSIEPEHRDGGTGASCSATAHLSSAAHNFLSYSPTDEITGSPPFLPEAKWLQSASSSSICRWPVRSARLPPSPNSSRSAYRLRNKAGAESFARAWDAALSLAATRLAAIAFDRALHGRSERFYRDGELVMERKMPSDYLLTWLLSWLDPLQFGSPTARALAAGTGDPRERSRNSLPELTASLTDDDSPTESGEYLDERLGEVG